MNYCAIGEKIRKYRKAKGMSQEKLAETVGISVTHMSHIETGNTKLSLPVCVELADALEVQVDDLLCISRGEKTRTLEELDVLLSSCSPEQVKMMLDILKATKMTMEKHMK